jgi:hypothetical protein
VFSSQYYVVTGGEHGGEAFKTPLYRQVLKEFLQENVKEVTGAQPSSGR